MHDVARCMRMRFVDGHWSRVSSPLHYSPSSDNDGGWSKHGLSDSVRLAMICMVDVAVRWMIVGARWAGLCNNWSGVRMGGCVLPLTAG